MNNVLPRALGAVKDPEDSRDWLFRALRAPIETPPSVDYEAYMSRVKDQQQRGACVAFAAVAVKEYQERRQRRRRKNYDLSDEWIYSQIMLPGGGAYIREGMKVLVNSGVPREWLMPYQADRSDAQSREFVPTKRAIRNANYYRATAYARLLTLEDMEHSLYVNGPFVLGIGWLDGWFDPTPRAGEYPLLEPRRGHEVGGHAICIVGYDRALGAFKLKNSWGPGWGRAGYAYLSYSAVLEGLYDAWASFDIL